MHPLLTAVVFVAGFAEPQTKPTTSAPASTWMRDSETRENDWREDIDTLVAELPKRHKNAFFKCNKEDFLAEAKKLRRAVPRFKDHEVVVGLMKLTAMIGDAHTNIQQWELRPAFHAFPISIYVFSDGPVIVAAREAQRDLIGCRVLKFGDADIDEAFRRSSAALAFENPATFKSNAPPLTCNVEIANAVGLIPTLDRAAITVRESDGLERTLELKPLARGENVVGPRVDDSKLPLSRQKRPHRNWFEPLPEQKTVYFRYNTCSDEPDQKVFDLSQQILKAIDDQHAERLIVDLRGNGGGNSGLLEPFLFSLRMRAPMRKPGGVICLIGRYTFSSAHMHAVSLKEKLGAILMGEPTGQKPNAYGEVKTFTLPHSGLKVQYSTKFWKTEEGDRPSLEPDILVELSSRDYFALKDPVFDAALAYKAE